MKKKLIEEAGLSPLAYEMGIGEFEGIPQKSKEYICKLCGTKFYSKYSHVCYCSKKCVAKSQSNKTLRAQKEKNESYKKLSEEEKEFAIGEYAKKLLDSYENDTDKLVTTLTTRSRKRLKNKEYPKVSKVSFFGKTWVGRLGCYYYFDNDIFEKGLFFLTKIERQVLFTFIGVDNQEKIRISAADIQMLLKTDDAPEEMEDI